MMNWSQHPHIAREVRGLLAKHDQCGCEPHDLWYAVAQAMIDTEHMTAEDVRQYQHGRAIPHGEHAEPQFPDAVADDGAGDPEWNIVSLSAYRDRRGRRPVGGG